MGEEGGGTVSPPYFAIYHYFAICTIAIQFFFLKQFYSQNLIFIDMAASQLAND